MTAKRVCAHPGCPILVTRTSRCPAHTRRRPSPASKGYGRRWRRTRIRVLRHTPACAVCGDPATQVHHLDGQGPAAPAGHDPDNLQALCHSCHSRITAAAGRLSD